jgi:uncharacterized protein (TIGR00730 family)
MNIFVGCSASDDIPSKYRNDCNILLDELFRNDNNLVFGACNSGIMADAYNSALNNKKEIIGICPEAYKHDFLDLRCSSEIITTSVNERTDGLIRESEILLFLPGGFGSVYELFTAIESKSCHEHNREIIIYNSKGFYDELLSFIEKIYDEKFAKEYVRDYYFVSDDKECILEYIDKVNKSDLNLIKK